ncbi:MAG: lytic transglycosylase domain-containing protein [Clostridia bacterium]|nr:lytic transglycosylase domain-containing protein [Clostridia bacterium]
MQNTRRFLAVLLIIVLALGIGFATDAIWNAIDRANHPHDSYREWITKYSTEYNVPEYVIYAVIKVESDFDPRAESSAGARGLMQMIQPTFQWLSGEEHLKEDLSFDTLYDPEVSIRYGTYYLCYLYKNFDYNWHLAFAAYNGGEGNVKKWLQNPEYTDEEGNLTYIPFAETRSYVSKVEHAAELYQKLYYQPNEGVAS